MSIDEAIAHEREVAKEQKSKYDKCPTRTRYCCEMCFHNPKCNESAEEHEQLAEWLEKLKYIENIILKWNADIYNDEDTGIPDNEILEAIFNACTDNGFDIQIDEDYIKGKKDGYNKAISDYMNKLCDHCMQQTNECYKLECPFCTDGCDIVNIAEQLKAGGEDAGNTGMCNMP